MRIAKKLLPLLGVVLWFGTIPLLAQEDEPPEMKQYRDDYERYQKIKAMKDRVKRADELLQFLKDRSNSKLELTVQADYWVILQDLNKESKWDTSTLLAERLVKVRPKTGEAYYFLGQSLKEQKKLPEAMDALAKCVVLKNQLSAKARQFLEYIYKSVKGNLNGLDALLQKAVKDLGA